MTSESEDAWNETPSIDTPAPVDVDATPTTPASSDDVADAMADVANDSADGGADIAEPELPEG